MIRAYDNVSYEVTLSRDCIDAPFFWWNDLDYTRLHSMLVDLFDEALEIAKLIHCLWKRLSVLCKSFSHASPP